jgi:hypothetical protein
MVAFVICDDPALCVGNMLRTHPLLGPNSHSTSTRGISSLGRFDPTDFHKLLVRARACFFIFVPTFYQSINDFVEASTLYKALT